MSEAPNRPGPSSSNFPADRLPLFATTHTTIDSHHHHPLSLRSSSEIRPGSPKIARWHLTLLLFFPARCCLPRDLHRVSSAALRLSKISLGTLPPQHTPFATSPNPSSFWREAAICRHTPHRILEILLPKNNPTLGNSKPPHRRNDIVYQSCPVLESAAIVVDNGLDNALRRLAGGCCACIVYIPGPADHAETPNPGEQTHLSLDCTPG